MCDELVKDMPALAARDVSSAILYAISVKPNVQVKQRREIELRSNENFLLLFHRFMRSFLSPLETSCKFPWAAFVGVKLITGSCLSF